jgi:hypothetical protein
MAAGTKKQNSQWKCPKAVIEGTPQAKAALTRRAGRCREARSLRAPANSRAYPAWNKGGGAL